MEDGELSSKEVVVTALVTVEVLVTVLMTVTDAEVEVAEVVKELALTEDVDGDVVDPSCEVTDVEKVEESSCDRVLGDVTDVPAEDAKDRLEVVVNTEVVVESEEEELLREPV